MTRVASLHAHTAKWSLLRLRNFSSTGRNARELEPLQRMKMKEANVFDNVKTQKITIVTRWNHPRLVA